MSHEGAKGHWMGATKMSQFVKSPQLTGRQMDCAILAAKGMTSKEIARQLDISPSTVDTHLSTVLARYNLRKRSEISLLFREFGENSTDGELILQKERGETVRSVKNPAGAENNDGGSPRSDQKFKLTSRELERLIFVIVITFILWYLKY